MKTNTVHGEQLSTGIPHAQRAISEESGHGVEPQSTDFAKRQATVRTFLGSIST
jgi:hypothetical protein